MVLIP